MWTYLRTPFIEFGIPGHVSRAPLKSHVHNRTQIMVVTKGARRIRLGGQTVIVPRNSMLIIPPGVAHAADEWGWEGFNAYIDPSFMSEPTASLFCLVSLPRWMLDIGRLGATCDIPSLTALMAAGTIVWSDPGLLPYRLENTERTDWPQSREAQIRRYQREAGISPHAHFKAIQLDQARQKLANGEAIASIAAELGFADQSHLGRQFRAAFGTSPGRYATG